MKDIKKIKMDDKVTIAYQTIGDDKQNQPLLVFLHEGLGSIAQWKDFPQKLCNELQLPGLVYDRYGYGHSTELQEKREADYLHVEAEYFLPQLIDKLQLQNRKLILVSHSDGASIALIYTALFPKNILAVVSIAGHVFVEQISIDSIQKAEKLFEGKSTFKSKLEKYHFGHTESIFYAFSKTITSKEFKNWNIEKYLSKIYAPILIIQGENDEHGTIKQVDSIYNNSSNTNNIRFIIKNCGHSPHISHAETVINEIKKFIVLQKQILPL
jgi:pimeloyl-ACP methyl ester carboxylesterase